MTICAKADNRKLNDCTRGIACVCLNEHRKEFEDLFVNCRNIDNDLKNIWKERHTTVYVNDQMQHRFEGFVLAKEHGSTKPACTFCGHVEA